MAHETYLGREIVYTLASGQDDESAREAFGVIVKVIDANAKVMDISFSCKDCIFRNVYAYGVAYSATPEIGKWSWPS